jgi:hypothetical protein
MLLLLMPHFDKQQQKSLFGCNTMRESILK